MPLILVNSREVDLLTDLLKQNDQSLRLYVNDYTPAATSVIGDFTEMSTHGYVQKTITALNWTIVTSVIGATAQNIEQTWTFTSEPAVTVYGYYMVDTVSGNLIYAERFPNPQTVQNAGDSIKITPKVAIENNLQSLEELIIPTGTIMDYAAIMPPTGWLLCDGTEITQTEYVKLFDTIGSAFNKGDEQPGNFRLPDFRGRVPIGAGLGEGLILRNIADKGGGETHQLVEAELPSHNHIASVKPKAREGFTNRGVYPADRYMASTNALDIYATTGTEVEMGESPVTVSNTGNDQAFSLMQPYLVVNKIIKH